MCMRTTYFIEPSSVWFRTQNLFQVVVPLPSYKTKHIKKFQVPNKISNCIKKTSEFRGKEKIPCNATTNVYSKFVRRDKKVKLTTTKPSYAVLARLTNQIIQ